jgi:hypothetical protein
VAQSEESTNQTGKNPFFACDGNERSLRSAVRRKYLYFHKRKSSDYYTLNAEIKNVSFLDWYGKKCVS